VAGIIADYPGHDCGDLRLPDAGEAGGEKVDPPPHPVGVPREHRPQA